VILLRDLLEEVLGHANGSVLDALGGVSLEVFSALIVEHVGALEDEVFAAPVWFGGHHAGGVREGGREEGGRERHTHKETQRVRDIPENTETEAFMDIEGTICICSHTIV
jgi:hypothetical protein